MRRALYSAVAVLSGQFFVAQAIVQAAWLAPFSLSRNYISDLGNTTCGPFPVGNAVVEVCSPWHAVMNASFIALGIGIVLGGAALGPRQRSGTALRFAKGLIGLAGPGIVLVGLFPEDQNLPIHKLGAGVQFISGNLGLMVLGFTGCRAASGIRTDLAAGVLGFCGLVATGLFAADWYAGIGVGAMERIAAYPLPIWLALAFAIHATVGETAPPR